MYAGVPGLNLNSGRIGLGFSGDADTGDDFGGGEIPCVVPLFIPQYYRRTGIS